VLGSRHVVSGHTASDRAETLLLHLARGSHRRGLGSLRSQRPLDAGSSPGTAIQLCRPLLIFARQDTLKICSDLQLPLWLDPGNSDSRFSRNRVRHEVLAVLEQLHPGAARRISGSAERLCQEQEHTDSWLRIALLWLAEPASAARAGDERPTALDRGRLQQLPIANQRALLAYWLGPCSGTNLRAETLETVLQRLQPGQPPGASDLSGGWRLQWDRSTLKLIHA
jgi:tRNA(Ile)-lysidine synthase